MNELEVDKLNEVYLQIRNLTQSSALELKEYFSCFIDNYWFSPKVKAKLWDGKISFYDWKNQTIPFGLFPQFVKFCNKFNYQYKVNFSKEDVINQITDEEFEEFYEAIFKDSTYSPRDYQDESIKKALRMKRGVIESATASGKSLSIYAIIRFILGIITENKKILFVVPNINLVNQIFSDFVDYGWKQAESNCSLIYNNSKKVDWEKPIIISTWQSLIKKPAEFFQKFQAVIVDEVHLAQAISINKILKQCINADYRIGLTGTMPESLISQFTIYGYLGPKIFEIKSFELIEKGILSKIKIANILLQYPKETVYEYWHDDEDNIKKTSYQDELNIIYGYKKRNEIFKYIINNINQSHNVLILCHKINHLKLIKEYIEKIFTNHKIYEIYGLTEGDERERIRKLSNLQESTIILGTYATLSTGFNLPRLHHIIFASSFRSKIKILQSIGRGLRVHDTKDRLLVWDIVDDLSWVHNWGDNDVKHINYVYEHWKERLRYYNAQNFNYITKVINISDITI